MSRPPPAPAVASTLASALSARASAPASAPREWQPAALTIEGLVAKHGDHAPLTLRLPAGRIAAIVGPTGIGKTSLLRALLGLDVARAGTVSWGDEALSHRGVGPRERPFAWVPQDAPILGDTLVANVVLGSSESYVDSTKVDDGVHAARVLGDLGAQGLVASLGDSVLATDRSVSGGERQWIAVARALATRLPVLLLDEPTSSLDGAAQERMLRAIAGLRDKRTVVIVTHRTEPLAIADVVVRIERATTEVRESHGQDAQRRTRRDDDALGSQELSVEDVGAVVLREAQLETSRERIDVPGAD